MGRRDNEGGACEQNIFDKYFMHFLLMAYVFNTTNNVSFRGEMEILYLLKKKTNICARTCNNLINVIK